MAVNKTATQTAIRHALRAKLFLSNYWLLTRTFFEGVASVIEQAISFAGRTADITMCAAYYEIGRRIVENEQDGKLRAQYGHGIIRELSSYLKERFGKGFSESTLKYARQFYTVYSNSIRQTNFGEFENDLIPSPESVTTRKGQTMFGELNPFKLKLIERTLLEENDKSE